MTEEGLFSKGIFRGTCHKSSKFAVLDPCVYCGKPSETVEHVIPLSKGGKDSMLNRARACFLCNQSRGSTGLLKFLLKIQKEWIK